MSVNQNAMLTNKSDCNLTDINNKSRTLFSLSFSLRSFIVSSYANYRINGKKN